MASDDTVKRVHGWVAGGREGGGGGLRLNTFVHLFWVNGELFGFSSS